MPTGYTAPIIDGDGISFEAFVWRCAREFGALMEMRERPLDFPVPEHFTPSEHYRDALRKAQSELSALESMTEADQRSYGERIRGERIESALKASSRTRVIRDRLLAMREKVENWVPPTADHQGLKAFMVEQIDSTLQFDGNTEGIQGRIDRAGNASPEVLWSEVLAAAMSSVEYYKEQMTEEQIRYAERNQWIKDLRDSVPPPIA